MIILKSSFIKFIKGKTSSFTIKNNKYGTTYIVINPRKYSLTEQQKYIANISKLISSKWNKLDQNYKKKWIKFSRQCIYNSYILYYMFSFKFIKTNTLNQYLSVDDIPLELTFVNQICQKESENISYELYKSSRKYPYKRIAKSYNILKKNNLKLKPNSIFTPLLKSTKDISNLIKFNLLEDSN